MAPRPLTAQADLTLYRAVQEGLTNVRKHAAATRVNLLLDYSAAGVVRLQIADNGTGQAPHSPPTGGAPASGGFGLVGIRERVALLGGTMTLSSAPGQGFEVQIEVPDANSSAAR